MKLHLSILEKLVELPTREPQELRTLLDELGLEVKDVFTEGGKVVFNIETLANRGDHLYALGVAREIAARNLVSIKYPPVAADFSGLKTTYPVRCLTDKCSRYALLELALPANMPLRADVAAVMAAGTGGHHPIVDLTNYVQLELGQPMHAFDKDKIEGEIVIDLTTQPAQVEALDGKLYQVPANSIVIKDRKKIVAVAGIIGCANSMVTEGTTRVLMESALFDPVTVRKTARAMALSTDASYAFERGCDRDGILPALRRLVALAEGSGAESVHVVGLSYFEGGPTEKRSVKLSIGNVKKQLNSPRLSDVEVTARLKNLGYGVEAAGAAGELKVNVPSWRLWDVRNEEDLIEDAARSHGLSRIKLVLPPLDYEIPETPAIEICQQKTERALVGQGFYEVITKSFYGSEDVELLTRLDPEIAGRHMLIKNSIERGNSHLKVTNVIHLCRLAEQNHRKGVLSFKVYEFSRLFEGAAKEETAEGFAYERDVLSIAAAGRWIEHEWRKPETQEQCLMSFKGTLENLFRGLGQELVVVESKERLLHPGYQGALKAGRLVCGFFGLVHPVIRESLDIRQNVLYAELDMERLMRLGEEKRLAIPSEFPMARRDLTLKIAAREMASRVVRYAYEMKVPNLTDIVTVDDFRKQGEDFRRLSLRFTFQNKERTLEAAEVEAAMQQILSEYKEKHQIELAG